LSQGLDTFLLRPPFSAMMALLLLAGLDLAGRGVLRIAGLDKAGFGWTRFQAPVLGAALVAVFVYPLALAGYADLTIMRFMACVIVAAGLVSLFKMARIPFRRESGVGIFDAPFVILVLGVLGVYSLCPMTNADSLDYHLGVALRILNTGAMPVTPEWFHSRLAGSGEVLNAIGLAAGSDQFGAVLQLAGLAAVGAMVFHAGDGSVEWRRLVSLATVSSPVMLFLVGSAKPQLLPAAMTTLAMLLAVRICHDPEREDRAAVGSFAVVMMLTMVASQMKFSFLLGGGVAGIVALYAMLRRGVFLEVCLTVALCGFLILLPPVAWKVANFGGGWLESFLTPLPGNWPGSAGFEAMLRNYADSPVPFPVSLLIPSGPGTVSTVLGLGVVFTVLLRPAGKDRLVFAVAFFVAVLAFLLGPPTSRSYIEPFFWLMIILAGGTVPSLFERHARVFEGLVLLQAIGVILMAGFVIAMSLSAFFSTAGRARVMDRMADGYRVMVWLDRTLPADAVVLSGHRSMALVPRRAVSLDWYRYADDCDHAPRYLERLKAEGVTHILLIGSDYRDSPLFGFFSPCLGPGVYGPGRGVVATRNPFNRGEEYQAWAFAFKPDLLPGCVYDQAREDIQ